VGTLRWFGLVILVAAGTLSVRSFPVARASAAPSAVNCAALELHLAPGLHPPSPNYSFRPPSDAPRTPFTIALPLYPSLTPLKHLAGSPFAEIQGTPYLQTASAEFHSTASSDTVQAWYERTMNGCRWRPNGSWNGNAGAFPHGISFARGPNGVLSAYIGFADEPDGSTDVAIAVEAVRYPAPPAAARIHGPFVQLRITLSRTGPASAVHSAQTVHAIVTKRQVIARLVGAIDGIGAAYTVPATCFGGLHTTGPAWLTFVRTDGSQVHAFEAGPGVCGGGLAVNGFRWLLDPGTVWSLILKLTTGRS